MKDVYLLFHGRNNYFTQLQSIHRNSTAIISDVFNQTMGGKGVLKEVYGMWPLTEDERDKSSGSQMSKEDYKAILREHQRILNEKRKKNE